MDVSKVELLFYVFFFLIFFFLSFISIAYYLKFKKIEKNKTKDDLVPENFFDVKKNKIIIKKDKNFDWEIEENDYETKLKNYFGFDFFSKEKEFNKRFSFLKKEFENKNKINFTVLELYLLLDYNNKSIRQLKNGTIQVSKNVLKDFLAYVSFDKNLFNKLEKYRAELITNKEIEIEAKELFFLLKNNSIYNYDEIKNLFNVSIDNQKLIEYKKENNLIEFEIEDFEIEEENIENKKNNIDIVKKYEKTMNENFYFDEDKKLYIIKNSNVKFKKEDIFNFSIIIEKEKKADNIKKKVHESFNEERDEDSVVSIANKEYSKYLDIDSNIDSVFEKEKLSSEAVIKNEENKKTLVAKKIVPKKIKFTDRKNLKVPVYGFYSKAVDLKSLSLLIKNDTAINKNILLKLLFGKKIFFQKEKIKVDTFFSVDKRYFMSTAFLIYILFIISENEKMLLDGFINKEKLIENITLSSDFCKELNKIFGKNIFENSYSSISLEIEQTIVKLKVIEINKKEITQLFQEEPNEYTISKGGIDVVCSFDFKYFLEEDRKKTS